MVPTQLKLLSGLCPQFKNHKNGGNKSGVKLANQAAALSDVTGFRGLIL